VNNHATAHGYFGTTPVDSNQDEVTVNAVQSPAYTIDKTVTDVDGAGPTGYVDEAGDVITYQVVVTNTGNQSLTGITLVDSLVASLGTPVKSLNTDNDIDVGETWTWTYTYTATQADIDNNGGGDGDIDNTATVDCDQLAPKSDSEDVPIDQSPPVPLGTLNATKTDELINDADGDGYADPGDTLLYTVTIVNVGDTVATGVVFTDTPDVNTRLVANSVSTSQGTVTGGNAGVPPVTVNVGTIAENGGSVTITFKVTINNPLPARVTQVANQGLVSSSNGLGDVLTDDPSTQPQIGDPTITPVHRHQPAAVPSVSVWGIVVMTALFAGSLVWLLRRRATADTSKQRG